MRQVTYLSPTSIKLFYTDRSEFYVRYLAVNRPPRFPQTRPMSVGSAFDAFIKNYLIRELTGHVPPEFEIDRIFESQVEEHNRDWAKVHGMHVFQCYRTSGACSRLLTELSMADALPQFEFTVEGPVNGINLLGKPDVYYTVDGSPVILDWKVNGYCSTRRTSPTKGYIHYLEEGSRNHGRHHKDAMLQSIHGTRVNIAMFLEQANIEWAQQLAIYSWVLGVPVGSPMLAGIDQIVGVGVLDVDKFVNKVGFAIHRSRISESFQLEWFEKIQHVRNCIDTDYIFDDMTINDSRRRCDELDNLHLAFGGDKEIEAGSTQEWYNKMMGR